MRCKNKIKWKGLLLGGLVLLLLFFVISLTVPPLFQTHDVEEEHIAMEPSGKAERVRCIDDNQDALLWRLRVIEQAEKELIFSTFSYEDDEAGRDMMAALLHAAERGVRVRMIVDGYCGFTGMQRSKLFRALADAPNVEIRFYNPVNLLKPWKINYRMHDKYLIADHAVYLLGGRNTKNLSLGEYQEKRDLDRDVLVYHADPGQSGSLQQLKDYFEEIWNLPETKSFRPGNEPDEKMLSLLRNRYAQLRIDYPEAFEICDWEAVTMETEGITLLSNPIQAKNKQPVLWTQLMQYMTQGTDILIQTPYMICGREMYADLYRLNTNETHIAVLTNSVETGANLVGCTDYINEGNRIQSIVDATYEYMGDRSVHTKTILVDEQLSFVGSFNCDMRSAYLDTELMLAIKSRELNAQLRKSAQETMEQSRCVKTDGTVTLGSECPDLRLSTGKKLLYGLLRYCILPIRHLL